MANLKEKSGRPMATDVVVREDEPGDESPRGSRPVASGGFFTIYKKGQGYWTRMGTAGAAVLVGILVIVNLFEYLPALGVTNTRHITIVATVFGLLYALGVYWLINRPTNAEFLIATDSEMKKVNWTSRQQLIGSTKVVVGFMLLVAALLWVIDLVFQTFFWAIDVIKIAPFFINK
jgi:preprotein translocase subunit SecE